MIISGRSTCRVLTLRPASLLCRFVAARLLRRRRRRSALHRASQNALENSAPMSTLSAQPPHLKPSTPPPPPPNSATADVDGDRPQPHLDAAPVLQVLATACSTAADDNANTNACSRLPGNTQQNHSTTSVLSVNILSIVRSADGFFGFCDSNFEQFA